MAAKKPDNPMLAAEEVRRKATELQEQAHDLLERTKKVLSATHAAHRRADRTHKAILATKKKARQARSPKYK